MIPSILCLSIRAAILKTRDMPLWNDVLHMNEIARSRLDAAVRPRRDFDNRLQGPLLCVLANQNPNVKEIFENFKDALKGGELND